MYNNVKDALSNLEMNELMKLSDEELSELQKLLMSTLSNVNWAKRAHTQHKLYFPSGKTIAQ